MEASKVCGSGWEGVWEGNKGDVSDTKGRVCGEGWNVVNEVSMYGSGGGNTVCHLNIHAAESSLCANSSGGTAFGVPSEVVQLSCKVIEVGREGKGSGELAGDKGSKPKEEHSGSASKESDFIVGESEGSVEDSVRVGICGEFAAGNTVSTGGGEEVARVEEMMDRDVPRVQNGCSELGNTGVPSCTAGSWPVLSATEMKAKKSSVLGPFGSVVATASGKDGLEG